MSTHWYYALTSPAIDLVPVGVNVSVPVIGDSGKAAVTVTATVYNGGTVTAYNVPVLFERNGEAAGSKVIGVLPAGDTRTVQIDWSGLTGGGQCEAGVRVDPDDEIAECSTSNNSQTRTFLVASQRVFLPSILKVR